MPFLVRAYNRLLVAINPRNWYWWGFAAIMIRLILVFSRYTQEFEPDLCIGKYRYDYYDYICPVENFLSHGRWFPDLRLPGYSLIYLLFRIFLPMKSAIYSMFIFQTLIGGIASYMLARSIYEISRNKYFFLASFLFIVLNKYMYMYDGFTLTDSISQNFIAISVYFFCNFLIKNKISHLFYSGIFLGYSAFMRPANVFAFPLSIIAIYVISRRNLSDLFKKLVTFMSFYFVMISLFILVYYANTGRIFRINLQQPFEHSYARKILIVHGSMCLPNMKISIIPGIFGEKCSEMYMFGALGDTIVEKDSVLYLAASGLQLRVNRDCLPGLRDSENLLRGYFMRCIHTSKFNVDSLVKLRVILHKMALATGKEFDRLRNEADAKLELYLQSVKDEYPLYYYFISKVKSFTYLIINGHLISPGHSRVGQLLAMAILLLLYKIPVCLYFVLFPVVTLLSLIRNDINMSVLMLLTLSGPLIVLSYIVVSLPQVRYMMSAYPYIFLGVAIELWYIGQVIRKKGVVI